MKATAIESLKDYRTISHDYSLTSFNVSGGYNYLPTDIEHQHNVGICTAISLVQNAEKALGKKYSPDFQYLLQKKFIDKNWDEGSSVFSAMKVGKNYGFLPIEFFTYITEKDRLLNYSDYVKKLQNVSDGEITRLLTLCKDKLTGYAQVDISNPTSIATTISQSKSGICCRYEIGQEWWTDKNGNPSWNATDINPLRPPVKKTGGHAIIQSKFDYTNGYNQVLVNTWGVEWCKQGTADINYSTYKMTEAWIPYYDFTPVIPDLPKHQPLTVDLYFGMMYNNDVKRVQKVLNVIPTGNYGYLTVQAIKEYAKTKNISVTGLRCGPILRNLLNADFFN